MNRDEITKIVLDIAKNVLYKLDDVENITPQTNLEDFGADSLDISEIVIYIEKEFCITISDAEVENLRRNSTVDNFVDYIVEQL